MYKIANCSGFYGDRLSAAREQVDGGPIDALTGDWLAELTMLILSRNRAKAPATGYAKTFVTQMEHVMGSCLDKGIKVVTNAGGLNPAGCADAVSEVADKLGLSPTIAFVDGDDLMPRWDDLVAAGVGFNNLDTGESLVERGVDVLTANAYLGVWGIVEALTQGADIVITGRATDAAIVAGPAAWHYGWKRDDWDALAGAIVAGHVIECGAQATGGNYSFFTEIPNMMHPGFPIAEMEADGSSVITKHPGTDGSVTVGTVTSQLLYEIGGPRYFNPDVVTRFDTILVEEEAPDRIRIHGTRGEPAPEDLKVSINFQGGFRNGSTYGLTGLDIEAKAALIEEQLFNNFPGGKDYFDEVRIQLMHTDKPDPAFNEEAVALLKITVKDADEKKVGRHFANQGVELALSSIPGFFGVSGGPGPAQPFGVFWPALVPAELVPQRVVVRGGGTTLVDNTVRGYDDPGIEPLRPELPAAPVGETKRIPLGTLFGARSGDKGGNANVGLFARSPEAYAWLESYLTLEQARELLPDAEGLEIRVFPLANIWSVNIVVVGLLEEGVAASSRQDGQAKGFGEYLRAKHADIPVDLL